MPRSGRRRRRGPAIALRDQGLQVADDDLNEASLRQRGQARAPLRPPHGLARPRQRPAGRLEGDP
eukprot:2093151-Pyramimonas_sp.AAC.1